MDLIYQREDIEQYIEKAKAENKDLKNGKIFEMTRYTRDNNEEYLN